MTTIASLGLQIDSGGAEAFLWSTPLGDLWLFPCADPKPTPVGGSRFKVTATFERAFHP